jgi:hypothetical protein
MSLTQTKITNETGETSKIKSAAINCHPAGQIEARAARDDIAVDSILEEGSQFKLYADATSFDQAIT